jgi:hypothetical protein
MVIVVSVRRRTGTRKLPFANRPEKPLTPLLRDLDFPDLLSGTDDERIGKANFHLVFNASATGKSLDHVIGVDPATGRWPA